MSNTNTHNWYLCFHAYDFNERDIKSDIVYLYLKYVKKQHQLLSILTHCSLVIWNDDDNSYLAIDPTYEGTYVRSIYSIDEYVLHFLPVGSMYVSFQPSDDMVDNFVERIDNTNNVSLDAFVYYVLGRTSSRPVCTTYLLACLGFIEDNEYTSDVNVTPLELLHQASLLFNNIKTYVIAPANTSLRYID